MECPRRLSKTIDLLLLQSLFGRFGSLGASFLVTSLITPTATVCFMSRTAKRPRAEYFWKDSTHMGLLGIILTMQESPDLTNLGAASNSLPVRLSILVWSSANLQAIWAVWQSRTGEYPAWIWPGWLRTIT